ncbi:oxidoreductase C-terminal domain-containing protein, partial [Williamsia muralis]
LLAADCINRPRDFMVSKRAITQQLPIDRSELVLAGSA